MGSDGDGAVRAVPLDVCAPDGVQPVVDGIAAAGEGLDVVVNNAAVMPVGPLATMEVGDPHAALATNPAGPMLLARACTPLLRGRAGGGRILNIGSLAGRPHSGPPPMAVYNVTKAALVSLSYELNKELAPHGIRCWAVEFGPWDTDGQAGILDAAAGSWPDDEVPAARLRLIGEGTKAMAGDAEAAADAIFAIATSTTPQVRHVVPEQRGRTLDAAARMTDAEFLALCDVADPTAWLNRFRELCERA